MMYIMISCIVPSIPVPIKNVYDLKSNFIRHALDYEFKKIILFLMLFNLSKSRRKTVLKQYNYFWNCKNILFESNFLSESKFTILDIKSITSNYTNTL